MRKIGYNFFRLIWRALSNSRLKNWLRIRGFYLFHELPKNILVSKGDVVLHAGCWQIETVREWSQSVGSEGKVIIVEANDYSFNLLTKELELRKRKLNNVTLIHSAGYCQVFCVNSFEAKRWGRNIAVSTFPIGAFLQCNSIFTQINARRL